MTALAFGDGIFWTAGAIMVGFALWHGIFSRQARHTQAIRRSTRLLADSAVKHSLDQDEDAYAMRTAYIMGFTAISKYDDERLREMFDILRYSKSQHRNVGMFS